MKILDFLREKKVDRKHFIYATGAIALGGFLLAKFPIKFLSKRAENIYSSNRKIQVRENPDSIKRINA
jgi:hypothetical protein